MNTTTLQAPAPGRSRRAAPASARAVLGLLERLAHGSLELQLPDRTHAHFGRGVPAAAARINDWNLFSRVLKSGDIGFAEGYIAGEWDAPDLTALLSLLVANRDAIEGAVYGSWWGSRCTGCGMR